MWVTNFLSDHDFLFCFNLLFYGAWLFVFYVLLTVSSTAIHLRDDEMKYNVRTVIELDSGSCILEFLKPIA